MFIARPGCSRYSIVGRFSGELCDGRLKICFPSALANLNLPKL